MTTADDHGTLPAHAELLLDRLDGLRSRGSSGRVAHAQHYEFADRARLLTDHLRAALLLGQAGRYASGLVTVRAALEHHLLDRLLFLGNRYLQVYSVKKEAVQAEEARLQALRDGPRPDIARWWMSNGSMNVIVKGLYPQESLGRGRTLSPYYFVARDYNPFTGRAQHQPRLAGAFWPVKLRRTSADEAAALWRSLFVFPKVRRNLLLNRLVTVAQALQLDVHYAFLSAYAHATGRAYELVYGRNSPVPLGRFDHYSSELILLYVITIAAEELRTFWRMADRAPRLRLAARDQLEREVADATVAIEYFWFLVGEPHTLDRINEVHTRMGHRKAPWTLPRMNPMSLPAARVRYYTNPLARIVELHRSWHEMTSGQVFRSPFERPDAQYRI